MLRVLYYGHERVREGGRWLTPLVLLLLLMGALTMLGGSAAPFNYTFF